MRVGESIHFGLLTVNSVNPHLENHPFKSSFLS